MAIKKIGSYEAKSKLPELLRRVEEGEALTITNRGKAVADIVPSRSNDKVKAKAAIQNILKSRKTFLSDDGLNLLISQGRK